MIKNLLTTIICVLSFFSALGQEVKLEIRDFTIGNNSSLKDGAIELVGNQSTNVSFGINGENPNGIAGDIRVFTKKSSLSFANQIGGVVETIFGGSGNTSIFTGASIVLNGANFNKSGGQLYAEFESKGGVKYKSNIVSIKIKSEEDNTPIVSNPVPPVKGRTISYFDLGGLTTDFKVVKAGDFVNLSGEPVPLGSITNFHGVLEYVWQSRNTRFANGFSDILRIENVKEGPKPVNSKSLRHSEERVGNYEFRRLARMSRNSKDTRGVWIASKSILIKYVKESKITNNTITYEGGNPIYKGGLVLGFKGSVAKSTIEVGVKYKWQKNDSGIWEDLKEGNFGTYTVLGPEGTIIFLKAKDSRIKKTTSYRRLIWVGGNVNISNVIRINYINEPAPALSNNVITGKEYAIKGRRPSILSGSEVVNMTDSSVIYSWEKKEGTKKWETIRNAFVKDYQPDILNVNTKFRRVAFVFSSANSKIESNVIEIKVKEESDILKVFPVPIKEGSTLNFKIKIDEDQQIKITVIGDLINRRNEKVVFNQFLRKGEHTIQWNVPVGFVNSNFTLNSYSIETNIGKITNLFSINK